MPASREPSARRRKAAAAVALASARTIFDQEISGPRGRLGNMTKFDFVQVHRRAHLNGAIARRVLDEVDFPDDFETPIEACAPPAQMRAIIEAAHEELDKASRRYVR